MKCIKPSNPVSTPCAAAAAKSLQSCLTLCDPVDCSPPGFSVCEIFQARLLEWVAIANPYVRQMLLLKDCGREQ